MQKELSWAELRKRLKTAKLKAEYKGRKCIWADTESGYILCTRQKCIKEDNDEKIRTG